MGIIRLEWPFLPPSELRGNSRSHHQAKAKIMATFKESTHFRIMEQDPDPMKMVLVRYTGYCCKPLPDEDNLTIGMKGALDAFTEYGVIDDDSSDYVMDITTTIIRVAHRNQQGMVMEVEEATPIAIANHYLSEIIANWTPESSTYKTAFNAIVEQLELDKKNMIMEVSEA